MPMRGGRMQMPPNQGPMGPPIPGGPPIQGPPMRGGGNQRGRGMRGK